MTLVVFKARFALKKKLMSFVKIKKEENVYIQVFFKVLFFLKQILL